LKKIQKWKDGSPSKTPSTMRHSCLLAQNSAHSRPSPSLRRVPHCTTRVRPLTTLSIIFPISILQLI
jgi:hypothetical protein